ncbi:WRKY DNA-binding protein [Striga asiatica]|uniref:WRKY DNA-binding protein n=1 Tax=Striga asiatica TaxID=4170 RepID=A0A5A7QSU2_STRAF|nr:WRKY DNA-binding protein [Striga asiatica]
MEFAIVYAVLVALLVAIMPVISLGEKISCFYNLSPCIEKAFIKEKRKKKGFLMGGEDFDDHVSIMGDWMPPNPSPRSLFSSVNETKTEPYQNNSSNSLTESKISSRGGGLMERRAARAGFNAPRLNTESIRLGDLCKEEVRSPYLTIPPGLSPTTLLDSPVFLTNSLVQPSPTTGKFAFASGCNNPNSSLMMMAAESMTESKSVPNLHAINRAHTSGSYPDFGITTHPNTSLFPHQTESPHHANKNTSPSPENTSSLVEERTHGDEADGYNWRKYGQKQVKGSEYPRSYYKCTHPSCPVKKKVERSHEGHITEIIYKGAHIHPKPTPPGRRTPNEGGGGGDLVVWPVGRNNNPEAPSSPSHEYVDREKPGADGSLEGSFTFSNEEDNDDDRATNGSVSVGCDGEGDESELKRRRIEAYASEVSGATRAMREPRVVVQTTSEVDILDDGYRWRKYGQKVVKGNPNPRSYYKCTSPGCNVRKHVERASHDLKSVITTYEGKHNHDVPAARNSNSGPTNQQHTPSGHIQRAEPPQLNATMAQYERPSLFPFGIPGRPQQMGQGLGFGFGLGQQRLAAGLGPAGKLPVMQVHHPYFGYRARPLSDMGFAVPKTEPKVEPVTDVGSDGSLVYQQIMSRLPLGPQM